MGFFKNIFKAANPINHLKNPKKGAKYFVGTVLDPAGQLMREGRGDSSISARSVFDPANFSKMGERTPTNYAPYTPSVRAHKLSPAAQQLYDNMKARMASRASGQQAAAPAQQVGMAAPARTTQPVGVAPPQQLADGGRVRKNMEGCSHTENKAGKHKRNGKYR